MTKKKLTQKDIEELVDESFIDLGIDSEDWDLLEDYNDVINNEGNDNDN